MNPEDMLQLVRLLQHRLVIEKKCSEDLQQEVQKIQNCQSRTSSYVSIIDTNKKLKEELTDVKAKLDDKELEIVSMKEEFKSYIESEQSSGREELNSVQQKYERKINELYAEIQVNQATADMNMDEIETNLKQQLVETSKQLRESNISCGNLREDLRILKEEYMFEKKSDGQKIVELKRKLEYTTEQLKITEGKLVVNVRMENASKRREEEESELAKIVFPELQTPSESSDRSDGYPQLDIIQTRRITVGAIKKLPSLRTNNHGNTVTFAAKKNKAKESTPSPCVPKSKVPRQTRVPKQAPCKTSMPPLVKCTDANKSTETDRKGAAKKRKLYNPDDPIVINPE